MLSINTNLSSLITQSSLKTSTLGLNQAIERMTTGFKINHAKDNAAGYSINTKLSTKISAYQVAEENAAMGLDMVTTASESLNLISNGLQRLRALQTQASNGTYGDKSLEAINAEANAIVDEIERTINTSKFNGIDVFRGQEISSETSSFIKEVRRRDTSNMTKLGEVSTSETLTGTYSIGSKEELAQLAEMTNNGLVSESAEFVLSNNIDLENMEWTPIGTTSLTDGKYETEKSFRGTFDGNGYVVSNLSINNPTNDFQGLFGGVSDAKISNLGIVGVSIIGQGKVGALLGAGLNNTNVSNCYVTGGNIIAEYDYVGGLVGWIRDGGSIENSYSLSDVSGERYVGGFCGVIQRPGAMISNCFAEGDITALNSVYVGGLVGVQCANTSVRNSYFKGNMNVVSENIYQHTFGGLIGSLRENTLIDGCYAVVSGSSLKGGLVGNLGIESEAKKIMISNSYILGDAEYTHGVLLGRIPTNLEVEIKNCGYSSYYEGKGLLFATSNYTATNISSCAPDYVPYETATYSNITNYNSNLSLQVGIDSKENSQIHMNLETLLGGFGELRNVGKNNSSYLLSTIDELLAEVSAKQTEYGAAQNRLESALEEISINYENLVSSRSTIRDADIAEESSSYIKMQILQQASVTLMATANQSPSIALQLI